MALFDLYLCTIYSIFTIIALNMCLYSQQVLNSKSDISDTSVTKNVIELDKLSLKDQNNKDHVNLGNIISEKAKLRQLIIEAHQAEEEQKQINEQFMQDNMPEHDKEEL